MYKVIKSKATFISLFIIFICIIIIDVAFCPLSFNLTNLWKGYYTILIKKNSRYTHNPTQVMDDLGVQAFISESSQALEFWAFSRMEKINITDCKVRLDPLDPRFDPYMKKMYLYFNPDEDWKAIFIKSNINPLLFYYKAISVFRRSGYNIKIPDINISEKIFIILAGILFLVCYLIFYKKKSKLKNSYLIIIIPWVAYLTSGDFISLLTLYLLFPVWFLFYEKLYKVLINYYIHGSRKLISSTLVQKFILLIVVFLGSILIEGLHKNFYAALRILIPFLFQIIFSFFYCSLSIYLTLKKEHILFEPIPIRKYLKKQFVLPKFKMMQVLLLIVIISFSFLLYYFIRAPYISDKVAYPKYINERKVITPGSLQELWENKDAESLPDLSDYLAHIAFQEGIMFKGVYEYPQRGRPLSVSYYKANYENNNIKKNTIVKEEYNKLWFKTKLKDLEENSIQKMLLLQGEAQEVAVREVAYFFMKRLPSTSCLIIFIVLYLVIVLMDLYLTPTLLYDTKMFTARRFKKVA